MRIDSSHYFKEFEHTCFFHDDVINNDVRDDYKVMLPSLSIGKYKPSSTVNQKKKGLESSSGGSSRIFSLHSLNWRSVAAQMTFQAERFFPIETVTERSKHSGLSLASVASTNRRRNEDLCAWYTSKTVNLGRRSQSDRATNI